VEKMIEIIMEPRLKKYDTCEEFAKDYNLGEKDLVLTNEYIFEPFFGKMNLNVKKIFQEKYGAGEPTDLMTEAIMRDAASTGCERIIAIGGGTIIDLAKVLSVAEDDNLDALYDIAPNMEKKRELIIVPTTCGTGSEMTNISILNRTRLGTKMGLVGPAMFADDAVLIPELLKGLPFGVFATSSIDALVHAVESALSPRATPYTRLFSYKAIEIIIKGFQKIAANGKDARVPLLEDFLIASNYAGIAFGTAGCAAVHALSYSLGGTYHVAHGESNYAIFTGVLKNYMEIRKDGSIAEVNAILAELLGCDTEVVYEKLEELLNNILPKKALREYGVTRDDIQEFTDSVFKTQTRLMNNNFVPLDRERVLKIYNELF